MANRLFARSLNGSARQVCAAAAAQPRARSTFRAGVGSKVALISSVAGLIETIWDVVVIMNLLEAGK
jgi:hypothetical protein